jgi:diguanylate cyclase (GGDEF)-like protein/PAS domain S-box-containing protein
MNNLGFGDTKNNTKTSARFINTQSKDKENHSQAKSIIEESASPKQLSLKESEMRYRRLFEAAQDGILILDAETGLIEDVNPYLIDMLGYSRDELITRKLWEVGAFKDVEASETAFRALQKNEYIKYKDLPLRAKNGHLIQVEFVSNVYLVGSDRIIQCNIRNITDQKQARDALLKSEATLRELSVRDHLTGLFNRRYLEETLKRELLRAKRKNTKLGIIMMDIDNFKHANDTFGHAAGDFILQEMAHLLLEHIRGEDVLSRYGGDEFVVVLTDASLEVVLERAELLRKQANQHKFKFRRKNIKSITLSLGVANFPENGVTYESLLNAADVALYQAKHEGRDRVIKAKKNRN